MIIILRKILKQQKKEKRKKRVNKSINKRFHNDELMTNTKFNQIQLQRKVKTK